MHTILRLPLRGLLRASARAPSRAPLRWHRPAQPTWGGRRPGSQPPTPAPASSGGGARGLHHNAIAPLIEQQAGAATVLSG